MGFVLSKPNVVKFSRGRDCPPLVAYGSSCMQGWRVSMEDAHTTIAELQGARGRASFFAVYDGHGGRSVSRFASRHVHLELVKAPTYQKGDMQEALKDSYKMTDALMRSSRGIQELKTILQVSETELAHEDPEKFVESADASPSETSDISALDMDEDAGNSSANAMLVGCTAVSLYIDWEGHTLFCANAGDSRCVISDKGVPRALSVDHKPDLYSEKVRIEKANGYIRNGRVNANLNLTRTLGDFEYKQDKSLSDEEQIITCVPDVLQVPLTNECEFAILGCDGIWDVLTNQAAVNFIHKRLLPKSALTPDELELVDSSRLQAAQDDAAAINGTEPLPWPGDCATSLEELLNMVSEQTLTHCLAPNVQCGIGCDNMTIIIVLFRENLFGKRVIEELEKRLSATKESAKESADKPAN